VAVTGHVSLVGAGPGDPGLMTRKAIALLRTADLVLYDALIDDRILRYARRAQRFFVGKRAGRHQVAQTAIHALMIRAARRGRRVVRLKGGDPFVFGRGGEEMLACVQAGVAFEVVPGITSAIAAPALAGIPVTHRGLAQSFAVVTGSTAHGDRVDLARVATSTDTLVVLMAAGRLAETCAELIAAGRPATEPAAIVQWAATREQRTIVGTLEDLPRLAAAARIGPPATLVVGAVVTLAPASTPVKVPAARSIRP
jgi:uroporphyrin-III C-methyltransferase